MEIIKGYGLKIGVSNGGHIRLEQDLEMDGVQVILLNKHEAKIMLAEIRRMLGDGEGDLIANPLRSGDE